MKKILAKDIPVDVLLNSIINCQLDKTVQIINDQISLVENKNEKLALILFSYDFHKLKKQVNQGIVNKEDEFVEERKIVHRLLEQIL